MGVTHLHSLWTDQTSARMENMDSHARTGQINVRLTHLPWGLNAENR